MRFAPLLLPFALAACLSETDQGPIVVEVPMMEELPPGYPPKMGTATLTEGGQTATLTTYDFSVGAFDASAWFDKMEQDAPGFHLHAFPNENPHSRTGALWIVATFAGKITPGATATQATVDLLMGDDWSGRRWTSTGKPATLVIDSFTPDEPGHSSGYGRTVGHYAATICSGSGDPAVVAPGARCREISGTFATAVQFEP